MTFIYFAALMIGGFILVLSVITVIRMLNVRAEAAREWAARSEAGDMDGVDEAGFRRAYLRAFGPRGQIFTLATLLTAGAMTLPALALTSQIWRAVIRATFEPGSTHWAIEGGLVWQFYIFFSIIIVWAVVAALFAQRYHKRRPGKFHDELTRVRAGLER